MSELYPLNAGGYRAVFSERGGTCFLLRHLATGADILRTPSDGDELKKTPFLFGNPILFPPNRISGGRFLFDGREYVFPVNEPRTGCHLHGELYRLPMAAKRTKNGITFSYSADKGQYLGFPHAFELTRNYRLEEDGLTERVKLRNLSPYAMPFMLAFHTTFRVPFLAEGRAERCSLYLPVGREQLRNGKFLPTLDYSEGGERERFLREGNYFPAGRAVSAFYQAKGERICLKDEDSGISIIYTAESKFGYRLLWSDGGNYVVTEPQTCAIDCFHLSDPPEENGLIVVPPFGEETLETRICIES